MAGRRLLFVPVPLERGWGRLCSWLISCFWWRIFFLRDFPALQVEQRIHGGLAIPQDTTKFPSSPISGAKNFTERNGFTGEFGTHGAAQEFASWKTRIFCHVGSNRRVAVSPTYAASV